MKTFSLILYSLAVAIVSSCSHEEPRTLTVANPVPGTPVEKNINIMAQRLAEYDINVKEITANGDSVRLTFTGEASDSLINAVLKPVGRLDFLCVSPSQEAKLARYLDIATANDNELREILGEYRSSGSGYISFTSEDFNLHLADSILTEAADSLQLSKYTLLLWQTSDNYVNGNPSKSHELYVVDYKSGMHDIQPVDVQLETNDMAGYVCSITLTEEDSRAFSRLSEQNIGKLLPVLLDGHLVAAPNVNCKIDGGKLEITCADNWKEEFKTLDITLRNPYIVTSDKEAL